MKKILFLLRLVAFLVSPIYVEAQETTTRNTETIVTEAQSSPSFHQVINFDH